MAPNTPADRVLVIDDDVMSREVLCVLLGSAGLQVDSLPSGDAALDRLRTTSTPPSVILADLQMSGLAGRALARALREICPQSTIVLAMSGSAPRRSAISLYDDFLLKPFGVARFLEIVEAHSPTKVVDGSPKTSPRDTPPRLTDASNSVMITNPHRPGPPQNPVLASSAALADSPELETSPEAESSPEAETNPELESSPEAQARPQTVPTSDRPDRASSIGSAEPQLSPELDERIYRQLKDSMPGQVHQLYELCVGDVRKRIANMRTLAANDDAEQFVRQAHAIKGGCGMLGASELYSMAARLEKAGLRSAGLDGTPGVNPLDELAAACDRLERILGTRT